MPATGPLRVVIVGCGNIAKPYAQTIKPHTPHKLDLVGAYDIDHDRAVALTSEFGGKPYTSLEEVLADPNVDAIVNLTIHQAHVEVVTKCLEAGKHVLTEKPIALDPKDAKNLVRIAKKNKRRLASAPITYMGEAQQTAWKLIREGRLGTIRVIYAEQNHGRIETWHPSPAAFYEVGAMYDVGVYPLGTITAIFGNATKVTGYAKLLMPDRTLKDASTMHITTPDWICGFVEFESGPLVRIVTSFYVGPTKQNGIEFHGDKATLHLANTPYFNTNLQLKDWGSDEWTDVPLVKEPYKGVEWARGLTEMHDAIVEKRPHRAAGEQAAHIVEIIAGIHKSAQNGGRPVKIKSTFTPPAPMPWAL